MHRQRTAEIPEQLKQFAETYPETAEFVRNYPEEYDKIHVIDLTDEVKPGKIPILIQWDQRWGYEPYGDGWIGDSGCAPTSMAMILIGLTGNLDWNPKTVAEFSESQGWYLPGIGTSWELMTTGAEMLGLNVEEGEISENYIRENLSSETPMIASMYPGDFTTGGHILVLTGFDADDQLLLHDPNSPRHSIQPWNLKMVLPQIKHIWKYSAKKDTA